MGRKYRTLYDDTKKEADSSKTENEELKKKLEEAPVPSESSAAATEAAEKSQVCMCVYGCACLRKSRNWV